MASLKEFSIKRKEDIKALTEQMVLLISLCQKLPPDTLRVLELHYLDQKSLKEICAILDKSMTVVRNHRNRGIFLLKEFYEKENKENL